MEYHAGHLKARHKFDCNLESLLGKFADNSAKYARLARLLEEAAGQFLQHPAASRQAKPTLQKLHTMANVMSRQATVLAYQLRDAAGAYDADEQYKQHGEHMKLAQQAKVPFVDSATRELAQSVADVEVQALARLKSCCISVSDAFSGFSRTVIDSCAELRAQAAGISEADGSINAGEIMELISPGAGMKELLGVSQAQDRTAYSVASLTVQQAPNNGYEPAYNADKPCSDDIIRLTGSLRPVVAGPSASSAAAPLPRKHPKELQSAARECAFVYRRPERIIFETEYVVSGPSGVKSLLKGNAVPPKPTQNALNTPQQQSFAQQTTQVFVPSPLVYAYSLASNFSWPSQPPRISSVMSDTNARPQREEAPVATVSRLQKQLDELRRLEAQLAGAKEQKSSLFDNMCAVHDLFNNVSSFTQSRSNTSNSGPDPLGTCGAEKPLGPVAPLEKQADEPALEVRAPLVYQAEAAVAAPEPVAEAALPPKRKQAPKRRKINADDLL